MAESAGGVFRRPPGASGDIQHAAALGVLPASLDDRLGDRGVGKRLGRDSEAGADECPGGTKSQGRGHAAAIGDPAGRQHRHRCRQIHHDGHERQGGSPVPGPMPTAFCALRHDDIGAQVHCVPGLVQVGDLNDQRRTGFADAAGERARITKRQHHRPGVVLQRTLDRADIYRPGQKPDTPRLPGTLRDDRQLAGQPVTIPVPCAQQPEPSATRDGRRQRTTGRPAHRRQRNRVLHTEHLRERRRQRHNRHHPPLPPFSGIRAPLGAMR